MVSQVDWDDLFPGSIRRFREMFKGVCSFPENSCSLLHLPSIGRADKVLCRLTCECEIIEIHVTVVEIYGDWRVLPNSDHPCVSIVEKFWNGLIDTLQHKSAPRTASG